MEPAESVMAETLAVVVRIPTTTTAVLPTVTAPRLIAQVVVIPVPLAELTCAIVVACPMGL